MCISASAPTTTTLATKGTGWDPTELKTFELKTLDWRSQAAVGCSDKVIHLIGSDCGKATAFHVHETFIAHGDRKCAYFENLFQCMERLHPESSRVIPVQLNDHAADAFPLFLDFLYGSPNFQVTTDTAVALRYLAEFFKNTKLLEETWKFIKEDMNVSNLEKYLCEAICFADRQTATWVAFGCAQNFADIDISSPIWELMSPDDFQRVISLARLCRTGKSQQRSELVAIYCSHHMKQLDERWFREVTTSHNLAVISPKAALGLLEAEFQLKRKMFVVKSNSSPSHMSSLQRRCVKALSAQSGGKLDPKIPLHK